MVDTGRCSVSYRTTKDNIDVGQIAKRHGGGGHPKASGFNLKTHVVTQFIADIFKEWSE